MATRRRLTSIRLDKIAAVDRPCQKHATVAIVKRAPVAILKQTFQQALGNTLLNDQVREAFYNAFDNMYEGKDAFRTALIDEFTSGGDGTLAADAYKTWLTGLVDRAITTVRAAGAAQITPECLAKAFTEEADVWLDSQQEQTMIIKTAADLKAAITKFDPTKSTVAERDIIVKAATDLNLESELPVAGPLAKADDASDVRAELAKMKAVADLTPAEKAEYDKMDAAGKKAFLMKSAPERATEIAKRNDADPVVFTCADGTEIRKSDGAAALMLAKRADKSDEIIKSLQEQNGAASIAKRALDFPNTANAEAILKGFDLIDDETVRKAAIDGLRAADKARGGAFKRVGGAGGGTALEIEKGAETVEGQMAAIVKRISDEQKVDLVKATVLATADPEYAALYAEQVAGVPHVQSAQ